MTINPHLAAFFHAYAYPLEGDSQRCKVLTAFFAANSSGQGADLLKEKKIREELNRERIGKCLLKAAFSYIPILNNIVGIYLIKLTIDDIKSKKITKENRDADLSRGIIMAIGLGTILASVDVVATIAKAVYNKKNV